MTKVIRFFAESLEHIVFPRADRESAFCRLAETARKSESDAIRSDFEMMGDDMNRAVESSLSRVGNGKEKAQIIQ